MGIFLQSFTVCTYSDGANNWYFIAFDNPTFYVHMSKLIFHAHLLALHKAILENPSKITKKWLEEAPFCQLHKKDNQN